MAYHSELGPLAVNEDDRLYAPSSARQPPYFDQDLAAGSPRFHTSFRNDGREADERDVQHAHHMAHSNRFRRLEQTKAARDKLTALKKLPAEVNPWQLRASDALGDQWTDPPYKWQTD